MVTISGTGTLLAISTCLTTFAACVLHCVGFGTGLWLVGDKYSPFEKIGLFRACFRECSYPFCPVGDQFVYDGCRNLWDEYFREIWTWIEPHWFVRLRNLAIVCVPLTGITFFVSLALALILCIWRYPRTKTPCRNVSVQVLSFCTFALSFSTMVMLIVVLTTFAFHSQQYGWMPMPQRNSFGYSFWLEVCACALLGYSTVANMVAFFFKTLRIANPKDIKVAEDMMLGRTYTGNERI